MDLRAYARLFWRYGWLIGLQALLTAAAAYGFSAIQLPSYEATARVFVMSQSPNVPPQDMFQVRTDYAAYLNSGFRAQAVASALQLDMTPEQLLERVEITAHPTEPTVDVVVEGSNPALAADIARAWAEQLVLFRIQENADLLADQRITAELLDAPTATLRQPQTLVNTVAGAFLGVVVGMVIVLFLDWLASSVIRTATEAERCLGVPVHGVIPAAAVEQSRQGPPTTAR